MNKKSYINDITENSFLIGYDSEAVEGGSNIEGIKEGKCKACDFTCFECKEKCLYCGILTNIEEIPSTSIDQACPINNIEF